MSTNENQIGVAAKFDIVEFVKDTKEYQVALAKAQKETDEFYKRQDAAAVKSAQAAKASAAQQTKSIGQHAAGFAQASAILTVAIAGIIAGYKQLEKSATELGDTETIAQFEAINKSSQALQDTFTTMVLEINKAANILPFFTGILETARQVIDLTAREIIFLVEAAKGLSKTETAGLGIEDLGKPENYAKTQNQIDVLAEAREKADAAFMKLVNAPAQAAITQQAAETEKELKKRFDEQEKYGEKFRDLQIKAGESILSAEKDYQSKSAAAWLDYIEKTNSIIAEGIVDRAKIQQDYSDKIAGAERDYQRGIEEANYNHGQAMADIERDYQKEIRDIQTQYQEDALDAVRNLDAIGLIRAKEKRDKGLASAQQSRDEQMAAEERDYQRSLYELVRALNDKKQEADDERQRDLEEQRRTEREKLAEAKGAYNQQMAEAQAAFNQKIAAIRAQYTQEDIEAQAHYLNQETALVNHLNAMAAIMARYGMIGGGAVTSPVRTPRGGFRRAAGGVDLVDRPTQFTAGEAGPELAIFAPLNRALPSPAMQVVNHTGDFTHSIDAAISSSVAGLDGRIMAVVRKALSEVIR